MIYHCHRRLERMRAVRLEREKKERARANRLITGEPDPEEVSRPEHIWNVVWIYRAGLQKCRRILLSCFEKFPLILQLLPCSTGYRNLNTKSKQNIATLLQAHSVYRYGWKIF